MSQTQNTQNGVMKTFAVLGFVAIIIFAVWLAVQIVSLIPGAFSSLASIADGVYNNRPATEIVVANENSIVTTNEAFDINWTAVGEAGVYTFAYECVDGVQVDMRFPANSITEVPCGEIIRLGGDMQSLEIIATSEARRFTDVPYSIGFIPAGDTDIAFAKDTTFTVVNANITQSESIAVTETETEEPTGEVAGETATEPEEVPETETPVVTTPVTPAEPEVIYTEVFELPSSDPDGFVDLAVKYLGVGSMNSNNVFIPGGTIDNDTRGAFQFEVRNLGTKTSDDWSFEATLTSGATFDSQEQDGLKPNERSIFTLGFDNVGDTGAQTFGAEIDVDDDINSRNDSFTWAVNVTN